MSAIKTDAEYADAIKALLDDVEVYLTPSNLPLTPEAQARFIHVVFGQVYDITHSEPHLRGAVVQSVAKMQEHDIEEVRDRSEKTRRIAMKLATALRRVPPTRLSKEVRALRQEALDTLETTT